LAGKPWNALAQTIAASLEQFRNGSDPRPTQKEARKVSGFRLGPGEADYRVRRKKQHKGEQRERQQGLKKKEG
jgi:hypothetical protein